MMAPLFPAGVRATFTFCFEAPSAKTDSLKPDAVE
jgi:hypothetical protein